MGNIIELRPRNTLAALRAVDTTAVTLDSFEDSTRRLVGTAVELVETLEMSLARIRLVIAAVADAEASRRLAGDHAVLCAALRDAKAQLASIAADHMPVRR